MVKQVLSSAVKTIKSIATRPATVRVSITCSEPYRGESFITAELINTSRVRHGKRLTGRVQLFFRDSNIALPRSLFVTADVKVWNQFDQGDLSKIVVRLCDTGMSPTYRQECTLCHEN